MERSFSPLQGGSNPRTPETTGKLQKLQKFVVPNVGNGNSNLPAKDNPVYVGMESRTHRVDEVKNEKEKKGKYC